MTLKVVRKAMILGGILKSGTIIIKECNTKKNLMRISKRKVNLKRTNRDSGIFRENMVYTCRSGIEAVLKYKQRFLKKKKK